MKTLAYFGVKIGERCHVAKIDSKGQFSSLLRRSDLRNHSTRFDWGTNNGGASQLAIAILADCVHDLDTVLDWYQPFKVAFIRRLSSSWILEANEITDWLLNQQTCLVDFIELDRIVREVKGGAA